MSTKDKPRIARHDTGHFLTLTEIIRHEIATRALMICPRDLPSARSKARGPDRPSTSPAMAGVFFVCFATSGYFAAMKRFIIAAPPHPLPARRVERQPRKERSLYLPPPCGGFCCGRPVSRCFSTQYQVVNLRRIGVQRRFRGTRSQAAKGSKDISENPIASQFDTLFQQEKRFVADKSRFVACGTTARFARLYERVPINQRRRAGHGI